MPRQIFKNRVLAAAGPPPPSITLDNLRTWIPLRKGRFAEQFEDEVTHLLCTHKQFKKRVPLVKKVLQNYKRVHIVHYDWLEFSAVANRRLPEWEYSMRNIVAKERAEKREKNRQESGRREGERGVNPTLFHVYQDREFFRYQIDLTRNKSDDGEFGQRYTLTLWESNAKPHLYWFTAKFMRRKGDLHAGYHRPSSCSGKWRHEMDLFKNFFRIKTGIEWQDRVLLEGGKPVGRRLRFSYESCVELNSQWKRQNSPLNCSHNTEEEEEEEEHVDLTEAYNHDPSIINNDGVAMTLDGAVPNGDSFGVRETQEDDHVETELQMQVLQGEGGAEVASDQCT
ncbi:anthranilate synthase component II [Cordyceps javanica]|uniref:Anthranilate synthase component II n=1 Tax=Cordyceps javanica TaxID=43265 RepID=A0A545VF78_9HYPO|nr:anthranilate synthase component II [Cordyceps javanica]TQW11576.1 anthranilate synthase component II [Cordyceps javanica]